MRNQKQNKEKIKEKKVMEQIQRQINESYQQGVIENQVTNNKGIHTFNNQNK